MLQEKDIEQAYIEIKDTFEDTLLNMTQKKQFVISILKGQLANPKDPNISKEHETCTCGHDVTAHGGYEDPNDFSCFYSYNCDCRAFNP